eukprot:1156737-Pelagomonas_calceolata.AAC.9
MITTLHRRISQEDHIRGLPLSDWRRGWEEQWSQVPKGHRILEGREIIYDFARLYAQEEKFRPFAIIHRGNATDWSTKQRFKL